jgi:hypothetical protein
MYVVELGGRLFDLEVSGYFSLLICFVLSISCTGSKISQ